MKSKMNLTEAKEYLLRTITIRNFDTVYETLSDRWMKNACRDNPIDHFIYTSQDCLVGISLLYGTIFTIVNTHVGVVVSADQQTFVDFANKMKLKETL